MVYIDPAEIKYMPFVKSWLNQIDENLVIPEMKEFMLNLFEDTLDNAFEFIKKKCVYAIHQVTYFSFEYFPFATLI